MSFLKGAFAFKKTKPRKAVSRSPLKLDAEESYREYGPKCEIINVKVADRKIVFDVTNADWNTAGAESLGGTSSATAREIQKQVEVLQEENNMLKLKVEVVLNLVAESVAELTAAQR